MSIRSGLLFLLCLFLHGCNARPVPGTTGNKQLDEKIHISDQKRECKFSVPVKDAKVIPIKPFSSNEHGDAKDDSIVDNHQLEDDNQKLKNCKAKKKLIMNDEKARKHPSGAVRKESLVSVPWCVPHDKHGEKHPGFNLDYSPPKTHPPSHN